MAYDVIIIGAGSAGCALAGRLSEDGSRRVLVIEAGPHYRQAADYPDELLKSASTVSALPGHPNNWSFMAQISAKVAYPVARGKVVGGSSALNATVFIRGAPEDFDGWAAEGNDAWSFEKVLPYFRKLETDHTFGGQYHGASGPIPVTRLTREELVPDQAAFMAACLDAGFPEDLDKNAPDACGVGIVPMNNIDGVRINAAMAYLEPALQRANLTVMSETLARRIVFDGKTAVGVEVERNGAVEVLHGGEVVLCAGAIKSPHLLLLSGIGPASDLSAQGVEVVHDSPGVGENLMDHPSVVLTYSLRRNWKSPANLQQLQVDLHYTSKGSDKRGDMELTPAAINPFASGEASGLTAMIRQLVKRPLSTLAGLRGISLRRLIAQIRRRDDLLIICSLQQPEARGRLKLASADPNAQPRLSYGYFESPSDRRKMREALRLAAKLLEHKAFRAIGASVTGLTGAQLNDDAVLDQWLVDNAFTAIHMAGTCKMGPSSDRMAVVDQHCRVHGVERLRVVDTSIQPTAVRRAANATAVMIGERAAEFFGAR